MNPDNRRDRLPKSIAALLVAIFLGPLIGGSLVVAFLSMSKVRDLGFGSLGGDYPVEIYVVIVGAYVVGFLPAIVGGLFSALVIYVRGRIGLWLAVICGGIGGFTSALVSPLGTGATDKLILVATSIGSAAILWRMFRSHALTDAPLGATSN